MKYMSRDQWVFAKEYLLFLAMHDKLFIEEGVV